MPIVLPDTHVICYILGGFLVLFGLISFFPNLASKVLPNAPASRKVQIAGAVWCLLLGIGLIVLGVYFMQNG